MRRSGSDHRRTPRKSRGRAALASDSKFTLYVEGARDREILSLWARRVDRELANLIEGSTVILGGRQPIRAVTDFAARGGAASGRRGLIVLDRDLHDDGDDLADQLSEATDAEGLDVFVWKRRHIESYLLVPATLRRVLRLENEDRRIETFIADAVDESASLHAKRLLGERGALARAFGVSLRAGEIAKAMRPEDLDADILDLFDRMTRASGLGRGSPEVVVRKRC